MIAMLASPEARSHAPREAQAQWAQTPIGERLRVIRRLRHLIAEHAEELALASAQVSDRPLAEKLASEVLPLADACRWLERRAAKLLAPRQVGSRGRPFWMSGISSAVQRQPFGLVLVIGPGNYPLFLPAVQTLHALVAGNAVLLKPAPETRHVAVAFAALAFAVGLDRALLTVLPESVSSGANAIAAGVDKVVFTGSSENGREVLVLLAESNTPAAMELSGEDAVLVLADADLDLVTRALRFGARLNAGNTCMAPRRLIVVEAIAEELLRRLRATEHCQQTETLCSAIERVRDESAGVAAINAGEFALGASIFSRDSAGAQILAARIRTGFVLINDLIIPTADPRLPFGGVKASGFGTTRGEEGLLEMTHPQVVSVSSGKARRHFDEPEEGDAGLFAAYLRAAHGRRQLAAIPELLRALFHKARNRTKNV
jgi:aldehyde dehydrogenase (NAD+)